jgi:Protein of unknown function (DUF3306)
VTTSENFVSRWARLKRNAGIQRGTEPALDPLLLPQVDAAPGGAEATFAQPRIDAVDEPFDPASLPSIETITVNTDIRGFLQSRVPAELTRAALRQAWASDPAIRDFIGIAENQWDFNDPDSIPGFGPLLESDNSPGLLAQALGRPDKLAGMIPEMPASMEQSLPAETCDEPVAPDDKSQQLFDGSSPGSGEGAATSNDRVAEENEMDEPPRHRSHGSALPR